MNTGTMKAMVMAMKVYLVSLDAGINHQGCLPLRPLPASSSSTCPSWTFLECKGQENRQALGFSSLTSAPDCHLLLVNGSSFRHVIYVEYISVCLYIGSHSFF